MFGFRTTREPVMEVHVQDIPLYDSKMEQPAPEADIIEPTEEESKSLGQMAFGSLGTTMIFIGAVGVAVIAITALSTWLGISAAIIIAILFATGLLFKGIGWAIGLGQGPLKMLLN